MLFELGLFKSKNRQMGEYIVEALKILNTLREVVEERNKVGDFDLTSELSRIDNAISEIESLIDIKFYQKKYPEK